MNTTAVHSFGVRTHELIWTVNSSHACLLVPGAKTYSYSEGSRPSAQLACPRSACAVDERSRPRALLHTFRTPDPLIINRHNSRHIQDMMHFIQW